MKRFVPWVLLALGVVNVRCDTATVGTTETFHHLVLGVDSPIETLPPAFTAEQTTSIREGFSWAATTALPETDEDGNPALHYALVLVRDREQLDSLYLSGMTFDPFPLFEEEQAPWEHTGMLVPEGDDHGTFAFAILPAAVYNEIRTGALAGEETFEVVALRDAPSTVRHASGTLRYDELARRGFTGAPPWAEELYGESESTGSSTGPLTSRGEKIRWLRKIARGFRRIGDAIRRGIARVRIELGDTQTFKLRIRILEQDEEFLGHTADPTNDADLLMQAWQGARRGQPVSVRGARVTFGSNMWMVQKFVDANGFVNAEVPDTRRTRIQLWLQNDAAQVLAGVGIFDQRLNITDDVVSTDSFGRMNITVKAHGAYVLGQATDSWSYARDVLGFTPRSARIALLPAERASFAPCLSYVRFELLLAAAGAAAHTSAAGLAVPFVPSPLSETLAAFGAALPLAIPDWDILVQGADSTMRVIPTHEYGHVHWCAQLRDVSHAAVVRGLIEGLQGLKQGSGADVPERTLTEAWADYFSAQVVGAVNYFDLDFRSGTLVADGEFFCTANDQNRANLPCLEDNWQGSTTLLNGAYPNQPVALGATSRDGDASIGTMTTLLVDAFDGPTSTMGSGTEWATFVGTGGPALHSGRFRFLPDDETVQLPPRAWRSMIRTWRNLSHDWSDAPVLRSLELVAFDNGVTTLEVCHLRNLHVPPSDAVVCSTIGPISSADSAALAGMTATAIGVDPTKFSCDANFHAQLFVAADGIDSIVWEVEHDGWGAVSQTQSLNGQRMITLDPPILYLDEAHAPVVVRAHAFSGGRLVTTTTVVASGSPQCWLME